MGKDQELYLFEGQIKLPVLMQAGHQLPEVWAAVGMGQ